MFGDGIYSPFLATYLHGYIFFAQNTTYREYLEIWQLFIANTRIQDPIVMLTLNETFWRLTDGSIENSCSFQMVARF